MDTKTKTFAEILSELLEVNTELQAAENELAELKQAGATGKSALDAYNRAEARLNILRPRRDALLAAKPAAELQAMRQEHDRLRVESAEAIAAAEAARQRMAATFRPYFDDDPMLNHVFSQAVACSKPVRDAQNRVNYCDGRLQDIVRRAAVFAESHGLRMW